MIETKLSPVLSQKRDCESITKKPYGRSSPRVGTRLYTLLNQFRVEDTFLGYCSVDMVESKCFT